MLRPFLAEIVFRKTRGGTKVGGSPRRYFAELNIGGISPAIARTHLLSAETLSINKVYELFSASMIALPGPTRYKPIRRSTQSVHSLLKIQNLASSDHSLHLLAEHQYLFLACQLVARNWVARNWVVTEEGTNLMIVKKIRSSYQFLDSSRT